MPIVFLAPSRQRHRGPLPPLAAPIGELAERRHHPAAFPRQCLKGRPCSTGSVYSEFMANLTLAIDDDLLQRAREAALRQHTTVNALVRDFLGRYVEARSRRLEALEQFEAVAAVSDSASRESWGRESLHDRS